MIVIAKSMPSGETLVASVITDERCTGGGKTECYRMLRDASTTLHQQAPEDPSLQAVQTSCLNPKSISMSELYGNYNQVSRQLTDVQS